MSEHGIPEREHQADVSDLATTVEQESVHLTWLAHHSKVKRSQEPDADGNYAILDCIQCGEEINPERLKVAIKNTLCIYCATLAERR